VLYFGQFGIVKTIFVFNGAGSSQFLQAIHRTTYWINMWSHLLPEDQRAHMDSGCTRLMAVVRAIFNQDGWRHFNRIQDTYADFVFSVSMLDSCCNFSGSVIFLYGYMDVWFLFIK
jgi:hypothetical protein